MKSIVFIALIIISVTASIFNLTTINNVFSSYALGSTLWGLTPWLYAAAVVFSIKNTEKLILIFFIVFIVGALGIGVMADTLFFHPDAQGGLVFIFIPLFQLIFFVITTPLLFLVKNT